MNDLTKKVLHYAALLFLVAGFASGLLAFTYAATKDRIERQKFLQQVQAVQAAFPKATKTEYIKERPDLTTKAAAAVPIVQKVFEIVVDGKREGFAFVVAPRGYGGPLNMVVGIDLTGAVTGLKVSDHRETPGLGAEVVQKASFLRQFISRKPGDPVEIGKDIDAVSGSTITSKALTAGVRGALDAFTEIGGGR